MHRYFSRSSNGTRGILRLRQHAPVEFQLTQFAVEEILDGNFLAI